MGDHDQPHRYRRRPTEIEAMFFNGHNADLISQWCGEYRTDDSEPRPVFEFPGAVTMATGPAADLWVGANYSIVMVRPDTWIAKDKLGFYPIDPAVFSETYFLVEGEGDDSR